MTQAQVAALMAGTRHQAYVSEAERGLGGQAVIRRVHAAIVAAERAVPPAKRFKAKQMKLPLDPTDVTRKLAGELPESPQREAYFAAMAERITGLYDEGRFEEGDLLLAFLPDATVTKLLDEYFWED